MARRYYRGEVMQDIARVFGEYARELDKIHAYRQLQGYRIHYIRELNNGTAESQRELKRRLKLIGRMKSLINGR